MGTAGFYKNENGVLQYAPNAVMNSNYILCSDSHIDYTYPVDGWYWFNSENEAKASLIDNNELPYNENGWQSRTCSMRIVAPVNLVSTYPQLLFDLTVVRKLQLEQSGNNVLIYCNYIAPEHQALIDGSNGVIYVENRFE